jgi:hypothetical protein
MANVPSEADRLFRAGRNKIVRVCLIWGIPLLVILVFAGLQFAGVVHLEEYFVAPPDKADPRVAWQALAALAGVQFLCVALGVLQGWAGIRRARQLRLQSARGTTEETSRVAP